MLFVRRQVRDLKVTTTAIITVNEIQSIPLGKYQVAYKTLKIPTNKKSLLVDAETWHEAELGCLVAYVSCSSSGCRLPY